MEVRPGMYMVADLDEEALRRHETEQRQFGALPLLAPILMTMFQSALKKGAAGGGLPQLPVRKLLEEGRKLIQPSPEPDEGVDDLQELGCDGRACRCRR